MSETELKTTVQAKQYLQLHRGIQNSTKHLKWSKKERRAKTIIDQNNFQGSEYANGRKKVLNICKYVLAYCLNMLKHGETEPKITLQAM